ncbi:hypothetical protein M1494_01860 [Candidatus Parvarchaeota archaeon]|nr:hypothetical protein [Candidatus Parvarchaeota archaeon]
MVNEISIGSFGAYAVGIFVLGIVIVMAFSIIGSFHTTLNNNGMATNNINTTINNVNFGINTISSTPTLLVVIAGIIVTAVFISFNSGEREERSEE